MKNMRGIRTGVTVILLTAAVAACSDDGGRDAAPARTIEVSMVDDGGTLRFEPEVIEARRGDVIRFVQNGAMPHNVQFVRNTAPSDVELGEYWSGPYLSQAGETYEVTIDDRFGDGEYEFNCLPHAALGMSGTLVVAGSGTTVPPAVLASTAGASAGGAALPEVRGARGLQPLAYELDGGVKVFHLTAERIRWETAEGKMVDAMAYNRMVPGPLIRVTEGDRVRIIVTNGMDEPTTTHWHGIWLPNPADGVPGVTQDPIMPGESFTYEFVANPAGTRLYHSHFNTVSQEPAGLYGMFIVEERNPSPVMRVHGEEIMLLSDGPHGFVINGKEFPLTEPMKVKMGERLRVRIANLGGMTHPMHLHGAYGLVVAKDGFAVPNPRRENTFTVNPGETMDVILEPTEEEGMFAGTWLWHCHVLSHATGAKDADGNYTAAGMIGIVQVDDGVTELASMESHTHH